MSAPFTTYAQNFEDVMLYRALGDVDRGVYIDIGAQDPDIDSVSKAFYERGWHGTHIEPVPEYAERLRVARPGDTIVEAAASNEIGTTTLTVFPFTGLSTVDPALAQRSIDLGVRHQPEPVTVPTITLAALASQLPASTVHWLKIDVEGHERAVLEGWDTNTLRPWVIVVEATLPNAPTPNYAEWEPIVLEAGYTCVYDDGLNRFYIEPQRQDLAQAFSCPPNPFDNIQLSRHSTLCRDVLEEAGQQFGPLKRELESMRAVVVDLECELEQSQAAYSQLLLSWSWRLTSPMRKFVDLFHILLRRKKGPDQGAPSREDRPSSSQEALSPMGKKWRERLLKLMPSDDD